MFALTFLRSLGAVLSLGSWWSGSFSSPLASRGMFAQRNWRSESFLPSKMKASESDYPGRRGIRSCACHLPPVSPGRAEAESFILHFNMRNAWIRVLGCCDVVMKPGVGAAVMKGGCLKHWVMTGAHLSALCVYS